MKGLYSCDKYRKGVVEFKEGQMYIQTPDRCGGCFFREMGSSRQGYFDECTRGVGEQFQTPLDLGFHYHLGKVVDREFKEPRDHMNVKFDYENGEYLLRITTYNGAQCGAEQIIHLSKERAVHLKHRLQDLIGDD